MKIRRCVFLTLLCLLCISNLSQANTMSVSEIKMGMQGYGRTVFLGTTIESFPVEVLAVIPQSLGSNLILIKAGGSKIEKIGGIASGMSGSPVYVEGKLIGAISRGFTFSQGGLALVTPIEEMLNLWKEDKVAPTPMQHIEIPAPYAKEAIPVQTPLLSYGLKGRALQVMEEALKPYNLQILDGMSSNSYSVVSGKGYGDLKMEPGSAISVDIMRGDMGLSFIGTVTDVTSKGILAFGHPLFNLGNVDFFMSNAFVHQIVPSNEIPFKLSTSLNAVGRISQDRGAGVTGTLGQYPSMVPLTVSVKDKERNIQRRSSLQLVKYDGLLGSLVGAGVLQLIDDTLDRTGLGAAKVRIEIAGKGLPGMKLIRENYFFSPADIGGACLEEIYYIMRMLLGNPFQDVDIYNIEVAIEVENRNNTAYLQDVNLSKTTFKPGEEIVATVVMRPYRKPMVKKTITVKIPKNMPAGGATLLIYGGPSYQHAAAEDNDGEHYEDFCQDDLKMLLDSILQKAKNNQLTVELYPYYYPESNEKEKGTKNEFDIKELLDTDFIIEGFWSKEIEIEEG